MIAPGIKAVSALRQNDADLLTRAEGLGRWKGQTKDARELQ